MEGLGLAEAMKGSLPPQIQNAAGAWLGKFHNLLAGMERGVTWSLGLNDTLDWASGAPERLGLLDEHRGKGDALRHILLAAELQQKHPMLAKPLLYGHEFGTNMLQGQRSDEREQDLMNNQIGLQLGQLAAAKNWTRADLERMAMQALPKASVLATDTSQNY